MSPSPKVLSENLMLYTGSYWENTAKVLPPSAGLPNGKIVVQLGEPRSSAGFVSRDLVDGAGNFATSAPVAKLPYPLDQTSQVNATDNQLIRLQDGALLASKNGYIWSDLTPRPAWFDTCTIVKPGVSSGRARAAVFIFRSADGGQSWQLLSCIDAAVVENGKYGWPQPGDTPGTFGTGGFDRTELHQNPWTGDIYLSGHGDGGPYKLHGSTTSNHGGVVFRSQDNGVTWKTFHVFDDAGNASKGAAPYAMASTLDHELLVFNVVSSKPTLHFVENGVMSGAHAVLAHDGSKTLQFGMAPDEDDIRGSQPCIARMAKVDTTDYVWIAYPSLNASGHQIYVVASVGLRGSEAPVVSLEGKVSAEQSSQASALMGAFVGDDLVDPQDNNPTPTVVFQWIDARPKTDTSPDNVLSARYQVFYLDGSFPPGDLSVSGGARRTFSRIGIGDYFSGGYFWMNDELNFLCQWREADGVKANIVSMSPIPPQRKFYQAAIDPLSLILSNQLYVQLTLPDPPPPGVLRAQIGARLRGLSVAHRHAALANVERVQSHARLVATEMRLALESVSRR